MANDGYCYSAPGEGGPGSYYRDGGCWRKRVDDGTGGTPVPPGGEVGPSGPHGPSHALGGGDAVAIDAAQVVTGTFADARLSGTVVRTPALAAYQPLVERGAANGYAPLDAGQKVPLINLPAIAITSTYVVASQAAMLASGAAVGSVAIRTDQARQSYILRVAPATSLGNWEALAAPVAGGIETVDGDPGPNVDLSGSYDALGTASALDTARGVATALAVEDLQTQIDAFDGGFVPGTGGDFPVILFAGEGSAATNGAALEAKLAAAGAVAGKVKMPGGTYFTDRAPRVRNLSVLEGVAIDSTVLKAAAGTNLRSGPQAFHWLAGSSSGAPIVIRDFTWDGNSANQSAPTSTTEQHGFILANYRGIIENCKAVNCRGNGFHLTRVNGAGVTFANGMVEPRVIRCVSWNVGGHGLGTDDPGSESIPNQYGHLQAAGVVDRITDGKVVDFLSNGVGVNSSGVMIADRSHIDLEHSAGFTLFDPHMYGKCGSHGINLRGGYNVHLLGHPYLEHFGQSTTAGNYFGVNLSQLAGDPSSISDLSVRCDEEGNAGSTWKAVGIISAAGAYAQVTVDRVHASLSASALSALGASNTTRSGVLYVNRSDVSGTVDVTITNCKHHPKMTVPIGKGSAAAMAATKDANNDWNWIGTPRTTGNFPLGSYNINRAVVAGGSPGYVMTPTGDKALPALSA